MSLFVLMPNFYLNGVRWRLHVFFSLMMAYKGLLSLIAAYPNFISERGWLRDAFVGEHGSMAWIGEEEYTLLSEGV
jgi:hypothetical protein